MAKVRRIIRKLKPPQRPALEDQRWPVYVALAVLGGFLAGTFYTLLDPGAPLLVNRWTWMLLTPPIIGTIMVAMHFVAERFLRRATQLSFVLSLMLLLLLVCVSVKVHLFSLAVEGQHTANLVKPERVVELPQYFRHQTDPQENPRRDFERPADTPTPEPDQQPLERDQPQPEQTPERPQPRPIEETEETVEPRAVARAEAADASPRHSETSARLSRQDTSSLARVGPALTAPAPVESAPTPQPTAVAETNPERSAAASETPERATAEAPQTDASAQSSRVARRTDESRPETEAESAATLPRRTETPRVVPRTLVADAADPSATRQTNPEAVRPQTTPVERRATAAPQVAAGRSEPAVTPSTDVTPSPQRREQPETTQPEIASTPRPVPSERSPTTVRPVTQVAAETTNPSRAPDSAATQPSRLAEQTSPTPEPAPTVQAEPRTRPVEPTTVTDVAADSPARRQTEATPVAQAEPTPTPTPRTPSPTPSAAIAGTTADATPAEMTSETVEARQTEPDRVNLARRQSSEAAVARASAQPSESSSAATETTPSQTETTRTPRADDAPSVARADVTTPQRSTPSETRVNVAARASNLSPTADSEAAEATTAVAESASQVERASAEPAVQRPSQAPQAASEVETAVAATSAPRAESSTSPTSSATPSAVASPSRQVANLQLPSAALAQATDSTTPAQSTVGQQAASPASTSVARRTTDAAAVSRAETEPRVGTASASAETATSSVAQRRPQADAAPSTAQAPRALTSARSDEAVRPNLATVAATEVESSAPASTPQTGRLTADQVTISRQASAAAEVSPASDAEAAGSATSANAVTGAEGAVARAAERQPQGPDAREVAQANTSIDRRRTSTTALPSTSTVADAVSTQAAVSDDVAAPRPSVMDVARAASSNPSGTTAGPSLSSPAQSNSTEVARAGTRQSISSLPSITPDAAPSATPARSTNAAVAAASPTNVESPAVAQADRGVGQPSAEPARMALTRGLVGVAGAGRSANLDRQSPEAEGHSAVASGAARRAEATQNTPEDTALEPSNAALVARSRAGAQSPRTTVAAATRPDVVSTPGQQQVAEVSASSSAALTEASSDAARGAISAARGQVEVDLGPTRLVSEGAAARTGGGGQPQVNLETQGRRLARGASGAAPQVALATDAVAETPAAPRSTGGGRPSTTETNLDATALARTDPGAQSPVSGGATKADISGPPSETSTSPRATESLARSEAAEAAAGPTTAGGGQSEPAENSAVRRLARSAATGAAAVAMSAPTAKEAAGAVSKGATPESVEATGAAQLASRSSAAASGAASPTDIAGAPAAAPSPAGSNEPVERSPVARADAAEAVPAETLAGGGSTARSDEQIAAAPDRSGGTAAAVAMASPTTAELPSAPPAGGGGAPTRSVEAADTAALASRSAIRIGTVEEGGPSARFDTGPPAQAADAEVSVASRATRAAAAEAAPGATSTGGGNPDAGDAGRMAERIARSSPAADGAPQPVAALAKADVESSPAAATGGGPEGGAASNPEPTAAQIARTGGGRIASGAPTADAKAGPPINAGGGEQIARAQVGRAEAARAATGQPAVGGGTAAPQKTAAGPALAVRTRADVPALTGAPDSSGTRNGTPIESAVARADRRPGGLEDPAAATATGAEQGEVAVDSPGTRVAAASGAQRAATNDTGAPSAGADSTVSAPRRSTATRGPVGPVIAAVEPVAAAGSPGGDASDALALAGGDVGPMSRQAPGGLEVDIDALIGPGGLGSQEALNVGYATRRTRTDSVKIDPTFARFDRQQVGGKPRLTTSAVVSTDPFSGRTPPGKGAGGSPGAAPPETEESIELGLVFLANYQMADGRWTLNDYAPRDVVSQDERAVLNSDTAATGLALLAFQGAGYNHREFRYRHTIEGGVRWLVDHQQEDGDLYVPYDDQSSQSVWLYSHSIAALALCEAYGMTQDPELREPAQKALDFIVASQEKQRGGWRYSPNYGSDTSVTGWMMMALKSGELAGLEVPGDTYKRIRTWLDRAQASPSQPYLYCYNPYAPDTPTQRHGREPSKTMTSVGLLMRLYSGWHRDNPNMRKGAEYLAQQLPAMGTTAAPQRDTYYWYYATQVMFHMGGEHWRRWNERLHPLLINSQAQSGPLAGSWDPLGYPAGTRRIPIYDRWGPHAGRIYVTTMNLLSLEVHYRHLPLYEDTAK